MPIRLRFVMGGRLYNPVGGLIALSEGLVKRVLIITAVAALCVACNRGTHGGAAQTKTETIAPAQAQPAPTGTEALTQTTDIEDSRSEGEGGVSEAATAPPAQTATTPPAKAPAKKKK
jgi:hypothetical protein